MFGPLVAAEDMAFGEQAAILMSLPVGTPLAA
jgi:hypothetical protein